MKLMIVNGVCLDSRRIQEKNDRKKKTEKNTLPNGQNIYREREREKGKNCNYDSFVFELASMLSQLDCIADSTLSFLLPYQPGSLQFCATKIIKKKLGVEGKESVSAYQFGSFYLTRADQHNSNIEMASICGIFVLPGEFYGKWL